MFKEIICPVCGNESTQAGLLEGGGHKYSCTRCHLPEEHYLRVEEKIGDLQLLLDDAKLATRTWKESNQLSEVAYEESEKSNETLREILLELIEAVRLFKNEELLHDLTELRATKGYAAMCDVTFVYAEQIATLTHKS